MAISKFKPFITGIILLSASVIIAQKEVYLNINHLLGNEAFALEKKGTNNLGQDFTMSRFDYYLSNIVLHHDGTKVTKVKDLYLFIQSKKSLSQYLGNYEISQLDSITFNIGIDSITNHADPSLWPADHALAPKDPDMHWGWAAGYKFVVIEGHNGPDIFYDLQIHAFGDQLLTKVVIPTKGEIDGNKLNISLDAHCQKVMDEVNLSKVVIVHGSSKDVIRMMKNFREKVFSVPGTVSLTSNQTVQFLKAYPNPSLSEQVFIQLDEQDFENTVVIIRDVLGNIVYTISKPRIINEIVLPVKGVYFIEVCKSGKVSSKGSVMRL